MSGGAKWVIERRFPDGLLDMTGDQPERVFGSAAINGISVDAMAKVVYRHRPDADMHGDSIATWPSLIDPHWIARPKYW